ncbi:MAG: 4Fe-4S dicluster domain-containing protein [Gorillibacterium sp.]|nr:4Fe-4S dicluster domain-containing protein [Gorillibacterium sp.]
MSKRKIITIHEELCNGCGICVEACHEGAIELVDGVAKLVSDSYCDGLGDCLPECPTGAIEMIEREAAQYDDEAVQQRMLARKLAAASIGAGSDPSTPGNRYALGQHGNGHVHEHEHGLGHGGGCPGSMARRIQRDEAVPAAGSRAPMAVPSIATSHEGSMATAVSERPSELSQWPIQLHLVNPANPYFDDANLLIAADCTAFAYADFHQDFIRNHITLIGCPKLDDNAYYAEKLTEILRLHSVRSITVVRMVVPCCGGIVQSVKQAMLAAQMIVPYREVTIGIDGKIC